MGKTGDLFKKIRDTKGTFHVKMGSIKDRNGRDLTEAEDIKTRWQEYTEELYKKVSRATLGITDKMEAWPQPPLLISQAQSWDEGVKPCDSDLFFPFFS